MFRSTTANNNNNTCTHLLVASQWKGAKICKATPGKYLCKCALHPSYLLVTSVHVCRQHAEDQHGAQAFADALYVARFRLFLAARLPATGTAVQDLPALLDDLSRRKPAANAAPADSVMSSIKYCAFLHSTLAWLAGQLTTPDGYMSLQHDLLQSDHRLELQQRVKAVLAVPAHQQLLIAHIQRQQAAGQPTYLADLLSTHVCKDGLGAWTSVWATAFR